MHVDMVGWPNVSIRYQGLCHLYMEFSGVGGGGGTRTMDTTIPHKIIDISKAIMIHPTKINLKIDSTRAQESHFICVS